MGFYVRKAERLLEAEARGVALYHLLLVGQTPKVDASLDPMNDMSRLSGSSRVLVYSTSP